MRKDNSIAMYMDNAWNSHGPCIETHGLSARVVYKPKRMTHELNIHCRRLKIK